MGNKKGNKKQRAGYQRFYEWEKRAEDDFRAMEVMLKEGGLPNPICFHAQQAGEKYLKGFLAFQDAESAKIHSLIQLVDQCIVIDSGFESLKEDAVLLNTFYIETRYPGDYPTFSMKEAKEAYEAAQRVKDFILEKIK